MELAVSGNARGAPQMSQLGGVTVGLSGIDGEMKTSLVANLPASARSLLITYVVTHSEV